MKKPLSKLERVPLREAWKHEANDFTPWLAEENNLNTLADALGLPDLELVATEHWVGEFKLDILCTSGDDQVIIENQLEKTNHAHLGQLLTYAAGTGAKKVIWVAESFRPEHVAALEFLNQNTTEELSFFAVEVELWRIGDSPLAPKFEVVAKPNDWAKLGREQTKAAANATPAKQRQLKLWTELVARLATFAPQINPQKPRPQHWLNNSIGRAGFGLNPTASHRDDRLGMEVYITHAESKKCTKRSWRSAPALSKPWALSWTGKSCPRHTPAALPLGGKTARLKTKPNGAPTSTGLCSASSR